MTRKMNDFDASMIMDGEFEMAGYEASQDTIVAAAQHLINTGLAWRLRGRVGRNCQDLIDQGLCVRP